MDLKIGQRFRYDNGRDNLHHMIFICEIISIFNDKSCCMAVIQNILNAKQQDDYPVPAHHILNGLLTDGSHIYNYLPGQDAPGKR